jgi:hypothetical protein
VGVHRAARRSPVYVQDRDGGGWKPFLDRVSVAYLEMVLSEVVIGRGPSGDMRELPGGLIAVVEFAYEQMAVPEYRLWADPGITVRWFSAPGKLLRMDGRGPRAAGCWPGGDPGRSGSHSRGRPRALGACPPSRPETRQPRLTRSSSRHKR